ncbi:hypothetical protein R3P38DRAFT_2797054 [Favolaschia claudopus]|uniref:Uncharacterized protein n=1 Tax=Favolaschia claudopus TaxID=2862362 RepID=A0AAW0A3S3_9AGAR
MHNVQTLRRPTTSAYLRANIAFLIIPGNTRPRNNDKTKMYASVVHCLQVTELPEIHKSNGGPSLKNLALTEAPKASTEALMASTEALMASTEAPKGVDRGIEGPSNDHGGADRTVRKNIDPTTLPEKEHYASKINAMGGSSSQGRERNVKIKVTVVPSGAKAWANSLLRE